MNFPLIVLGAVFVLVAARKIGGFRVAIWQAMTVGALAVLMSGDITPRQAVEAVDLDVLLFLFGMFVIGGAAVRSGYLYALSYRLVCRIRSVDGLILAVLFGGGLASALLMNDTLAIVGTPVVLRLAREHRVDPRLMLLALAFAITIGSVMSPIGNPQNLLIALHGGVPNPFVNFFGALGVPTLINLLIAYVLLRVTFRRQFHAVALVHLPVKLADPALARLARISLVMVVVLITARVLPWDTGLLREIRLSHIALIAALPVVLFARERLRLLSGVDWTTLLFFVAMFVLVASVWETGVLQSWMERLQLDVAAVPTVLGLSTVLSQLISNVPLVALYLPLLEHSGGTLDSLMALAAGSTIAGNLLILGAASNVIVMQYAEKQGASLGFLQFAAVGVPLGILNLGVYWLFLT